MKSQYLLTTIIISSLILFVISGATLAFADHPNVFDLTFDKESYEFGDTMYITAQFYEPFLSKEGYQSTYVTLRMHDLKPDPTVGYSENVPDTGILLLNYTFNESNYQEGEFSISGNTFMSKTFDSHYDPDEYFITLSSTLESSIVRNTNDIKIHNSTLAQYDTMMYELQNTVQLQDTVIVSLQSELNTIAELLDDLLNPIPIKDPIGIMPILPQPIIEHPIDVIPIPQRPTISNLSGTLYTNGTAIISWDITTDSVNQYKIKYTSEDKKVKRVTIRDGTITSYTVHNLEQQEYDFTLRAWTDAGKTNLAKLTIQP